MLEKEDLLLYLDQNRERCVCSEELMSRFSLTRASLWHLLRSLRSSGYRILSEHGAGYRLAPECELYTTRALQARLAPHASNLRLDVRTTLASTNLTLREMAQNGAPSNTVLIANQQSGGYGRFQRAFFSPNGGIYMSLLVRPQLQAQDALTLTTTAAVCVVEAIREVSGMQASIKWVNDIYLRNKKVCGILTESSLRPDGSLAYAIIGIGINVFTPRSGFPKNIRSIAGSVYPEGTENIGQRSELLVSLLNHLAAHLPQCTSLAMHTAYCRASMLPGHTVTVHHVSGAVQNAVVLGIDEQYRLLVRYADGTTDALCSGEVSVREGTDLPTF